MVRPEYLKGTDASPHEKIDYPFRDDFFDTLSVSDVKMGSLTIHKAYVSFVRAKCPRNVGAITNARRWKGFCVQLKAFVKEKFGQDQDEHDNYRGYYIKVARASRPLFNPPTPAQVSDELIEIIPGYVYQVGLLRIMWVNKECGFSAFAARTILEGEFVVEYLGKELTMEQGEILNKHYVDVLNLPSTMLDVFMGSK